METFTETATGKADLTKRFVAYLIDAIIAAVLSTVVGYVSTTLGYVVGAAYILLRDGVNVEFMPNRSIGKKVMGLAPVTLDGAPMDPVASLKRNWPFIIPFLGLVEAILVLTDNEGRRIGDKVANTKVIEQAA